METLDNMQQHFQEYAELKVYSEAQHKTIVQLTKKVSQLEEENVHLKKLLDASVPGSEAHSLAQIENSLSTLEESPALILCEIEIARLQKKSMDGPLTYEEAKKMDLYIKNLVLLKNNRPAKANPVKDISEQDLLATVIDINK